MARLPSNRWRTMGRQPIGIALVVLATTCTHHASTPLPPPTPSTFKNKLVELARTAPALPHVEPRASCPITRGRDLNTHDFGGYALGAGPAYPIIAEDRDAAGVYHYKGTQPDSGWWQLKTLWVLSPKARAPFLVRVTRLDGTGGVGLFGGGPDQQPDTVAELSDKAISRGEIYDQSFNIGPDGWWNYPGATWVRQAGCYAFQIDGAGFSYTIVFAAEP